jgi:hypothetical protein
MGSYDPKELKDKIERLDSKMDARFTNVTGDASEVKGKVDKVEIRLNAIESMLESVELGVEKTIIAILYNVEIKKV